MHGIFLNCVLAFETEPSDVIWDLMKERLEEDGMLADYYEVRDKKVDTEKIRTRLRRMKDNDFEIENNIFQFWLQDLKARDFTTFSLFTEADIYSKLDVWTMTISQFGEFRYACLCDFHYDHWQDLHSVCEYDAEQDYYKDLKFLSKWKFGSRKVDTSQNPGRNIHRMGYKEVVGSTIWIGEAFWGVTGQNKDEVLGQLEEFKIETIGDNIIKIVSYPEPFTSMKGEQKEIQDKLRRVIFPVVVEEDE